MKKKLLFILGAVIILAAIAAAAIFLISTKDIEPASAEFELSGTWKLYNYGQSNTDEQYLVFDGNFVNAYRNGDSSPVLSSEFVLSSRSLILKDCDMEYMVDRFTDNYLSLMLDDFTEFSLVRSAGDGLSYPDFDKSLLNGTWDVVLHGKDFPASEQIVFDDNTIKDYRDGAETPFMESSYVLSQNGLLVLEDVGLELSLAYLDADCAILVETQTGYVYDLVKAE